ncbi:hypothetical protein IPH19_01305 [Candidatus Uhrbacteria bacterium]|jgi:hypothetical protein|nr:MAG: hypothetical protein IPH19_01305 [Candidatus Uhrbacteria bacterium]
MMKVPKLEWVSLVYLLFFVLAVLSPSIHSKDRFGLPEERLEELSIFAFGIAGLATFAAYERIMERREKEREVVETGYARAKQELIESYAYIGSVNRKIELLKKVANDTSLTIDPSSKVPKELYTAIAMNACASAGALSAMLRVLSVSKMRTEGEYVHHTGRDLVFKIPNKDLRDLHENRSSHAFIRSEDGKELLVVPADHADDTKAFLLLHLEDGAEKIQEIDVSLLKVFVNQAQMLTRQFAKNAA